MNVTLAAISINRCTTISDFKTYIDNVDISYPKVFIKTLIDTTNGTLIVNYTSFMNKYYDYINSVTTNVILTDKELIKYKFRPKMLCMDLYNTVELWGLLLAVNNMTSITEFNRSKIKVFTTDIFSILNEIFILEKEKIINNNQLIDSTV